jgi:SWI/SNF-related matrix-associated actin-dependent regulator of chromatin subfamily A member 5
LPALPCSCFRIGNGTSSVNVDMLNKAHELVKPFMLRRLKVEVEKCLPPRIETRIACPLSEMQSFWYKRLLLKERDILLSRMEPAADGEGGAAMVPRQGNKADDWKRLQALWVQLRKCCNHPYLFPGAEPEESEATVELMVKASGKLHVSQPPFFRVHRQGAALHQMRVGEKT